MTAPTDTAAPTAPAAKGTNEPASNNDALPDVAELIDTAALFTLDSLLNEDALNDLSVTERVAVALFQFDVRTVQALMDDVPHAGLQSRLARAIRFEDPESDSDSGADSAAPDPASVGGGGDGGHNGESTGWGDRALAKLLAALETALGVLLGGEAPSLNVNALGEPDPLARYMLARVLLHGFPFVGDMPEPLFVRQEMSEGEMYCSCRYYLDQGRQEDVDLAIQALWSRYPKSGHLEHLAALSATARNDPVTAVGHLVNATVLRGIDERLIERVQGLHGVLLTPDGAGTPKSGENGANLGADAGLRGLRGMIEQGSYAERRGTLRLLKRPDSLVDPCDRFTDADLEADIAAALADLKARPGRDDAGAPDLRDPIFRKPEAPRRMVFVFPPRPPRDIVLALSHESENALIGVDVIGELLRNMDKLEPGWNGVLTPDIMNRHAGFLRQMFLRYQGRNIGPVRKTALNAYVGLTVQTAEWARGLWPTAARHLCVPTRQCAVALQDAGLNLHAFDAVHVWRDRRGVVSALTALGIPRAGRRRVLGRAAALRGHFYPL